MSDIAEKDATYQIANVALVTVAETLIVSSPPITVPWATARVLVKARALLTTGAGTTAVIPRIRRGNAVAGALISEGNAETIKAAAGSTEPFAVCAADARAGVDRVEYSLTLQQVDATANGSALEAFIEVEVLSG